MLESLIDSPIVPKSTQQNPILSMRSERCGVVFPNIQTSECYNRIVLVFAPLNMNSLRLLLLCSFTFSIWAKRGRAVPEVPVVQNGSTTVTMEKEILKLMGLPHRPKISLNTKLFGRRMSAPRFMIDLYNSLAANQSVSVDGWCCNGSVTDPRALRADTIMSYLNHMRGARPKISRHHATYRFKLEAPLGEKITDTEFRIYKEPVYSGLKNVSWKNTTYIVRLYMVVHPAQVLDLMGTRILRSWESGWQEFEISRAGSTWAKHPDKNFGLELSVETLAREEIEAGNAGFVGFRGPQEKRPFVVSFFEHEGGGRLSQFSYSQDLHPSKRKRRDLDSQFTSVGYNYRSSSTKTCGRRSLYVSFRDLGWEDWIIAPEGYSAYYCYGECSFPLNAHMNATNHAIVQTLVHLMNPSTVPKPCCAPTNLSPISVLYFDDSNNVVLKKYTHMVVKACGCH